MLDQNTIERITDAARIEDVVSDYVTLRKRGVNMLGLFPDRVFIAITIDPHCGGAADGHWQDHQV